MKFFRFLIVASLFATNLGCSEKSKTQASVASGSNVTLGQEYFDITNWLAPCDINEWPEHVYEEAGNYLALNLRLVGVAPVLADNGEPAAGVAPHSCHWTWATLTRAEKLKKPQVESKSVIRQFFAPCDVTKWTPEMEKKETEMYYKQGYELVASTTLTTEKQKARSSCYWTFALKNVQ